MHRNNSAPHEGGSEDEDDDDDLSRDAMVRRSMSEEALDVILELLFRSLLFKLPCSSRSSETVAGPWTKDRFNGPSAITKSKPLITPAWSLLLMRLTRSL